MSTGFDGLTRIAATKTAKRGAQPRDFAEGAVRLSFPAARYIFGQMLVVDGGMAIDGFEL